jgi:nucleotide-binding universal stress UspA family protein
MFKHLLVTLDGSARAESVLPHAIDIGRSMGAQVTLLRIVDATTSGWGERGAVGKSVEAPTNSLHVEQARSYLDRVADQIRASGVTASVVVKQGAPSKAIVESAREADADAIVMATHSRRGLNRLMFGSVAEAVLHESHLPILLVRVA